MLALINPVIAHASTDGRCMASCRGPRPAARAFWARRAISSSTFLPVTIIKSASSTIAHHDVREFGEILRLA